MSELILELYSEEIPARIQKKFAERSEILLREKLKKIALEKYQLNTFYTAKRFIFQLENLPEKISSKAKEIKGPPTSCPENALQGFLRKNNLSDAKDLEIKKIAKQEYYFFIEKSKKSNFSEILTPLLNEFLKELPNLFPKTMRWADYKLKWSRPLRNILCLFDDKILKVELAHLRANNISFGHNFLAKEKTFKIKDAKELLTKLEKNMVFYDPLKRKEFIEKELKKVADKEIVIEDQNLVEEVSGLVEYPVIMQAKIDEKFMALPDEVLITSLKNHQKYFCLRNKKGKLSNKFLFVSNVKTKKPEIIIKGNEKVLAARLEDALYFFQQDLNFDFQKRNEQLKNRSFHKEIGNLLVKTNNNVVLAKFLSVMIKDCNIVDTEIAAKFLKTDLTTEMVNEFPELQGIMGYHYALKAGSNNDIALAIKEHYLPQGNRDYVPNKPTSVAVALADKIDNLVSLTLIKELPTGNKDPFALRRAAIGIIKLILENNLNIPLNIVIDKAINNYPHLLRKSKKLYKNDFSGNNFKKFIRLNCLNFIIERFKTILKDKDIKHDIINALFDQGTEDDLLKIYLRSLELRKFIASNNGKKILASLLRASKIYQKAEKEDNQSYYKRPHILTLKEKAEKNLYKTYKNIKSKNNQLLKKGNYPQALDNLNHIISPIDEFFEHIQVNCEDQNLRQNRLKLLACLCKTVNNLANFDKIEKSN
jgi:glycyl-tRNA synthetase beta chain